MFIFRLHSLHEEDEMMTFIQEVAKHEDAIVVPVDVRKGSLIAGQKLFKLGPDVSVIFILPSFICNKLIFQF